MLNAYKGLPKSIYIFFVVQVINRFGDFVVPFLTLYLTKKLGLSFETAGAIVMVTSLLSIPGSLLGGKLADQLGRKKVYIAAQTAAGIFLIPCAILKSPSVIVLCILAATFFNGAVRPAVNSLIADILPPYQRQLGYSLNYLGINVGVALGPIVAGFLFNHALPLLFVGDAITSFIAVSLVVIHVTEVNPFALEIAVTKEEKEESGNLLEVLLRRPMIMLLLLIYSIYCGVYIQHRFSLPIMLDHKFLAQGPEQFGWLMSVNAFTVILLTMGVTHFTKRFKPLTNMAVAGFLYAIGFGMIGRINSFFMFIISTILWTLGEILMATNFGVFIANHSPRNFRARFSALSNLNKAAGGAIGTSLMGLYIGSRGINEVWNLVFWVACTSAVLMLLLSIYSNRKRLADN
ncbi:dipeptide/tripeptide permease [Desulfosporosinus acidiphilus SJ4]|uniref:Dipeptide/tripeptide permease n=1 Tax=Desulfosporosinus acidiphilus (strain DSM 22704 / JCM 16185 / SJ4) TaxID=646529 RepID=I4D9W2_DESAJ|nr:MFS transporter [Desulfosporosinus acidiphilus]AFM42586.1 dipeptide/tripeptide permease [Desulfosporosinus acidiphilus SJ4]